MLAARSRSWLPRQVDFLGGLDTSIEHRPTVVLPKLPAEPPPHSFPLVATVAPVLGSVLIWVITQSPFALVFAFLGPLIAVASLSDAALHGRRMRRKEHRRFESEAAIVLAEIADRHAEERAARDAAHPGIGAVLAHRSHDIDGWSMDGRRKLMITIGRGDARSALEADGPGSSVCPPDVRVLLEKVTDAALRLENAPIVVDATLGVGICGPASACRAAARACILQLARIAMPASTVIHASRAPAWNWLTHLPHRIVVGGANPGDGPDRIEFVLSRGADQLPVRVLIAVANRPENLPRNCRLVITAANGTTARLAERGSGEPPREVELECASIEEALGFAAALRRRAESDGLLPEGDAIPRLVTFDSFGEAPAYGAEPGTLLCAVGHGGEGIAMVDLVADGPHAVIGGTTGTGKSELLISWVLAMAARYPPSRVTFLLVDFKGGASFTALQGLPHSVGLLTDLDPAAAQRALESLRAELQFRERTLVAAGARALDDLQDPATLARLVIVVDEFAALANDFPELHAVFADLASRGRSLGIHLILCTQRPAESLRDSILANCTLRISLRLNSRADSTAILGTAAAAELPRKPKGRALMVRAGERPFLVQVAIAGRDDPGRVARIWADHGPVRRPWCDPLPRMLPCGNLEPASTGIAFARADLPGEQRQETAVYDPARQGHLFIQGALGAGKSTALTVFARSTIARWVPGDVEGAWDAISAMAESVTTGSPEPRLLLIDDVDALVSRFGQDHQLEFVDLLAVVLREGPRFGVTAALAATRVASVLQGLIALCDARLLLRMPNRQDHLIAGGRGDQYDEHLPPGGARWQGHLVQVAYCPAEMPPGPLIPATADFPPGGATAIVSRRPSERMAVLAGVPGLRILPVSGQLSGPAGIEVLRGEASVHTVLMGDPDAWQSAWSLAAAALGRVPTLFDGCSVGEFRALTRSRAIPPALSSTTNSVWLLTPRGELRRAVFPKQ